MGVEDSHGECSEQRILGFVGIIRNASEAVASQLSIEQFELFLHYKV